MVWLPGDFARTGALFALELPCLGGRGAGDTGQMAWVQMAGGAA
jgi:hypothetical protein